MISLLLREALFRNSKAYGMRWLNWFFASLKTLDKIATFWVPSIHHRPCPSSNSGAPAQKFKRRKSVFSLAFIRLMSDSNIKQINRFSQVLWLLCRSVYWNVYWKHTREPRQADKSWRSRWEQKITGFTRPLDGSVCPTIWQRTWINTRSNEGMRSRCGMRKAIGAEPFQVEEAEPEMTAESVKRKEHQRTPRHEW